MKRKVLFFALIAVFSVLFSACAHKKDADEGKEPAPAEEASPSAEEAKAEESAQTQNADIGVSELPQLEPLQIGETLVTLAIEQKGEPLGEITLRFFPKYAPKAVENFVTHAKDGYYDGVIFHRVMPGFMIQGGDPEGTGTGGESIWGGTFEYELTPNLRHFNGALAMAHSNMPDSNGSQFYIVQNDDVGESIRAAMQEMINNQDEVIGQDESGNTILTSQYYPVSVLNEYLDKGGAVTLDGGYTVFGQVVSGMETVVKIANVPVDDSDPDAPRPLDDVVIKKATVSAYNG